jgi:hypothetical protein
MHSDDFGIGIIVSPGRVPGISENRQGVCHGGAPNLPRLTINYLYAIVAITHPSIGITCHLPARSNRPLSSLLFRSFRCRHPRIPAEKKYLLAVNFL